MYVSWVALGEALGNIPEVVTKRTYWMRSSVRPIFDSSRGSRIKNGLERRFLVTIYFYLSALGWTAASCVVSLGAILSSTARRKIVQIGRVP